MNPKLFLEDKGSYDILDEFDSIIGLDKLKVIHINDSKNMVHLM